MAIDWRNPYASCAGSWLKGSLHAHATPFSPCSTIPLTSLCREYKLAGFSFLCVSEHMKITTPQNEDLVMLSGLEWNSRSAYMANRALTYNHHIGVYATDVSLLDKAMTCRDPFLLCQTLQDTGALLVANHPNWLHPEHYDQHTLSRLARHIHGVEIYNAVLEWEEGEADATGRWDRLLTEGIPLLGFAGDDSHAAADVGKAWLMVRAAEKNPESILHAILQGNFYCTTGALLSDIGRNGDALHIACETEARIRVIGSFGRLLAEHVGTSFSWNFNTGDTTYARFQIMDRNWNQAWSQPFFHTTQHP